MLWVLGWWRMLSLRRVFARSDIPLVDCARLVVRWSGGCGGA